jgi:hypothetical protein
VAKGGIVTEVIRQGQWYYVCCILDLHQASEDLPDEGYFHVFDTAEEAVADLTPTEDPVDIAAFWQKQCHLDHDCAEHTIKAGL